MPLNPTKQQVLAYLPPGTTSFIIHPQRGGVKHAACIKQNPQNHNEWLLLDSALQGPVNLDKPIRIPPGFYTQGWTNYPAAQRARVTPTWEDMQATILTITPRATTSDEEENDLQELSEPPMPALPMHEEDPTTRTPGETEPNEMESMGNVEVSTNTVPGSDLPARATTMDAQGDMDIDQATPLTETVPPSPQPTLEKEDSGIPTAPMDTEGKEETTPGLRQMDMAAPEETPPEEDMMNAHETMKAEPTPTQATEMDWHTTPPYTHTSRRRDPENTTEEKDRVSEPHKKKNTNPTTKPNQHNKSKPAKQQKLNHTSNPPTEAHHTIQSLWDKLQMQLNQRKRPLDTPTPLTAAERGHRLTTIQT